MPYETPFADKSEIIMTGNLIYRYTSDQIELEGFWTITTDKTKEKFSYLLLKKYDKLVCKVPGHMIDCSGTSTNQRSEFQINICSANLYEAFLINNANVFKCALQFISGEYHGFFMYYDKTIEDRFYLNMIFNDNQVRITGNKKLN
jgi:hypothetical protein